MSKPPALGRTPIELRLWRQFLAVAEELGAKTQDHALTREGAQQRAAQGLQLA